MFSGKIEVKFHPIFLICTLLAIYLYLLYNGLQINQDETPLTKYWTNSPLWIEDSKAHKNPHKFPYIYNPEEKICGSPKENSKIDLLIMVASGLKNTERRRSIRETWGSKTLLEKHRMKLIFLVGTTEKSDPEMEIELKTEKENYEDLVREDFLDSYQNLTLKTLGGIKWAAIFCPQTKWAMKTDDDMYLNIRNLSQHLNSLDNTKLITGCIKNGPQGAPQPVGVLPGAFRSVHPPFTAGAGYVISGDLIQPLFLASLDTKLIRVEDAFLTGYCASKLPGLERKHHAKFSCGQLVTKDCDMKEMLTGHKITPQRMKDIHWKLERGKC